METQNITLTLPKAVLRRIKILAAKKHTSVSHLLTETLEELAARETGYAQARQRQLDWLEHGFNLGTHGQADWARDDLHER
jgi:hypothetical protein